MLKNNIPEHEYVLTTDSYLKNIPDSTEANDLDWMEHLPLWVLLGRQTKRGRKKFGQRSGYGCPILLGVEHRGVRAGQRTRQQLGEPGPLLAPGLGEQLLELVDH